MRRLEKEWLIVKLLPAFFDDCTKVLRPPQSGGLDRSRIHPHPQLTLGAKIHCPLYGGANYL